MLTITRDAVENVHAAGTPADLWQSVQAAIELEHATIPPYLTALLSIKQGHNREVAAIIGSVVGQEMLHMAIACNLMNALGGSPAIDNPTFVPAYPGPLPMGVHSSLTVGLEKLSRRLVHDVFMDIEEPEQPIPVPVGEARAAPAAEEPRQFATIGEFYAAIVAKLEHLGPGAIVGDPSHQVVDERWFPADQLFPIRTLTEAVSAIGVIVDQGEGTPTTPMDSQGEVAHYYRFGEIVYGRRLVAVNAAPGWAYAGEAVPLDSAGVWDLVTDAKGCDYPSESAARVLSDAFNSSYSNLLRCLHEVFNGAPAKLDMALSAMVEMQLVGQKLVSTPLPGGGGFAAPTFEYVA
jgi:hypothetical protein